MKNKEKRINKIKEKQRKDSMDECSFSPVGAKHRLEKEKAKEKKNIESEF